MDFKSFKENALKQAEKIKNKTIEYSDKTISYTANKIKNSKFTINSKKDFDEFIKKSAKTSFKNKETGEEKFYDHRVLVIFGDENSDFFKQFILKLPILLTKGFSKSIGIRLSSSKLEGIKLTDYKITNLPSLVVFENEKYFKTINDYKIIQKLVNSLNLDIYKFIDDN